MPEVPTSAEAGLPGLISGAWYAMVGPPKLKPELRDQIAKATIEAIKMPDVQQRFRALNVEPDGGTPAETDSLHQGRSPALGRGNTHEQYRVGVSDGEQARMPVWHGSRAFNNQSFLHRVGGIRTVEHRQKRRPVAGVGLAVRPLEAARSLFGHRRIGRDVLYAAR